MANDANSPQKNTVDCQPPLKHIQEEENETITTHKKLKEVCRVCEKPFTVKKDKHNLIIGAQEVKPPYTLALEELTGLVVETTDDLIAVCGACRNLLNRYHRSSCEAERIGTLVKSMSVAHTKTTPTGARARKRKSTPTDGRVGKRIRIESLVRRLGFPKSSGCSPTPEPQSQPLPQPTALSSDDGAVRKTLVTMAPAVLHSQPVLSAVCSLKPGPQTLPQPTALSSDDGSVRKTLVNIAPAVLHSQPVLFAVCNLKPGPQLQSQQQPQSQLQPQQQLQLQPQLQRRPQPQLQRRPQPQLQSQPQPQLQSRPLPQLQSRPLPKPNSLSSDDSAARKTLVITPPELHSQLAPAAVSQTARNPAVEISYSRPQAQSQLHPESQHAPQPTVEASNNDAVKKKPATTVPVVWSADSVKAAVSQTARNPAVETSCSTPQPQSQHASSIESHHATEPTVQASSKEAIKKKPATTVPVVWSADSVKAAVSQTARNPAVDTSCSRPQPQSTLNSESQHAPQPTVQTSDDEAAGKKPATTVPVVWSADSVKSAICSLKPGSQSQPLPQPTALSSDDGAVRKTLVTMAPAVLHSQPVLVHVEGQAVRYSTCECPIGRDKCHHMAALLIWVEKNVSRTDVECVWKKANAPKGDDIATKRVSEMTPSTTRAGIKRPVTQEDKEWAQASLLQLGRFTGMGWILSPETPQTLPIKMFDGLVTSPGFVQAEDKALYVLSMLAVNDQEKQQIEEATVGQAKNSLWFTYRKKRITASNFGLVLAAVKRKSYPPSLFKTLLGQYNLKEGSKACDWGILHEPRAKQEYTERTGVVIQERGLFLSDSGLLGGSPDGTVFGNCVIEVKCPWSARTKTILQAAESRDFFMEFDEVVGSLTLKQSHNYWHQIQGNLHLTGANSCHLLVWTPLDLVILPVLKDPTWAVNIDTLEIFYKDCFLPYILSQF